MKKLFVLLFISSWLFAQERVLFLQIDHFTENNTLDTLTIKLVGNGLDAELIYELRIENVFEKYKFNACDEPAIDYNNFEECKKDILKQIDIYKKGKSQTLKEASLFSRKEPTNDLWEVVTPGLWCDYLSYWQLKYSYDRNNKLQKYTFEEFINELLINDSRTLITIWGNNESLFDIIWSGLAKDVVVIYSPYAP